MAQTADRRGREAGGHRNPVIGRLMDLFMGKFNEALNESDRRETEGWRGRIVLHNKTSHEVYDYLIEHGRIRPSGPIPEEERTATIHMAETTFIDLWAAGLAGTAREVFTDKYVSGYIEYVGDRWLIDSERFRAVFGRLAT